VNFTDLRTVAAKTLGWEFWEEEFKGVCNNLLSFDDFCFLTSRWVQVWLKVFWFLGKNVIGAKNRICSIECNCLHHIFHCDFAKLSERLSYWTLNSFQWKLAASTTPCVAAITYANSSSLILDQSESAMILVSMWFVATPM